MDKLTLKGTPKTPEVNLDPDQGLLEIKGRSNPENSVEFYKPIMDWADEYVKTAGDKTTLNIQLEHFNTSSSKMILDLFKRLEPILKVKKEVVVNWYYEEDDEDMLEAGEDYESIIRVPFKMIEIVD